MGARRMRRLFDDYIAHGAIQTPNGVRVEALPHEQTAPVIVVDNAARCFFNSPEETWDFTRDFPNVAPPWPLFFMEFQTPSQINVNGTVSPYDSRGVERLGLMCMGRRQTDGQGWRVAVSVFTGGLRGAPRQLRVPGLLVLDEAGVIEDLQWLVPGDVEFPEKDNAQLLWPFLFALSLLHCKNTTLRQVDPPEKLARAASKRGRPLHRYHVLEVEPMREILERDGDASHSGLKHALHICRGHFKDYRERGLFGRNHGVYWWPQYARGDVERGTVAKDYAV